MMRNLPKVVHAHLHNAIGEKHHLELGTGEIDIGGFLSLISANVERIVLETKTVRGLRASVRYLIKNGV